MKKLLLSALASLSVTGGAAFATDEHVCTYPKRDRKAHVELGREGKSCKVIVRREEENFEKSNALWFAKHQPNFCEPKLIAYLEKLRTSGWTCRVETDRALARVPAEASVADEGYSEGVEAVTPTPLLGQAPNAEVAEKIEVIEVGAAALPLPDRALASETLGRSYESPTRKSLLVSVEPMMGFLRMDGIDGHGSKAVLASKGVVPGGGVTVTTLLGKNLTTSLSAGGTYSQLETNSTVDTLSNGKQLLWKASLGLGTVFTSSIKAELEAGVAKQVFLGRSTLQALEIQTLLVPQVTATGRFALFEVAKNTPLGVQASLGFLAPASSSTITARPGLLYQVGLYGEFLSSGFPLLTNLYFEQRYQNTSTVNWRVTEVGLLISIGMELLEGES